MRLALRHCLLTPLWMSWSSNWTKGCCNICLPASSFHGPRRPHHVKKDHPLVVDGEGNLKVSKSSGSGSCDTTSDLSFRAWTRRDLAYDFAGLRSFQFLEQWTHKCFITVLRPVPQGYTRVALSQIIAADRHMWTLAWKPRSAHWPIIPRFCNSLMPYVSY